MAMARGWWRSCHWLGHREPATCRLRAQPPCSKGLLEGMPRGTTRESLSPFRFCSPSGRKSCQTEVFTRANSSDVGGVVQYRWVCFEASEVKRADVTVLLEQKVFLQNSLTMTPCSAVWSLGSGNIKHRSDFLAYNIMQVCNST